MSNQPVLRWLREGLFITAVLCASEAYAKEAFENLAGSWSGSGRVETSNGLREPVRCKANYNVKNAGQSVKLDLRCASDAFTFELSSNIDRNGETLSGDWFESTNSVAGTISGRNGDGLIEARADGDTFTALITVGTNGSRQSFLMESPGARVSRVSIDLRRGSR